MRIVHLVRRYTPDKGGVEKHVQMLNRVLVARGHELTVLVEQAAVNGKLPYAEESIVEQVHVRRFAVSGSGLSYKFRVWRNVVNQRALLEKADVIQVHDVFWWLLPVLPLFWKKIHITFHGYELPGPPTGSQRFWHQVAAKVSRTSLAIGGFHPKWYGVNPDAVSFGASESHNHQSTGADKTGGTARTAVFVGRLDPDLAIMPTINVFSDVLFDGKKNSKEIGLTICGDGSQMATARTAAKQAGESIVFTGMVSDPSIYVEKSELVIASSYLAIIEALALGKMVVSYAVSPLKHDYLLLDTPFADWILVAESEKRLRKIFSEWRRGRLAPPPDEAISWARAQTWEKLADVYEGLWRGSASRHQDGVE